MAQGINLLPELAEAEAKKGIYKRKVNVVSIAALLSVAVILLGLFAGQLFLQTSRTRVESESKNLEDQIASFKSKEIAQRALVDKLDQIDRLLNESIPVSSAVANISTLTKKNGSINLTRLNVKSDGDVQISGTAANSSSLGKFIKALISEQTKKIFDSIDLSDLSKEKETPYNFTIDMDFQLKGLVPKNETF